MKATRFENTKTANLLSLITALAAGISVLTTTGCKKKTPPSPPPPIVQVETVQTSKMPLNLEFIGQLVSPETVEVRARVEAFVEKMLFIEGSEVQKGAPLFLLDKKPLKESLDDAKGSLAEAVASLKKYQADVDRYKPLAAKRAVPQQDLDNAIAAADAAQAAVDSAEANVENAKINLGYCDVNAPISGLVGAKEVSVGSLVGKGEATLMATISQLDPIWFYCNISETEYLTAVQRRKAEGKAVSEVPISLILATGQEHPDKGHLVFVDRAVDVTTGTLGVRVSFPNTDHILRPGMFGRIRVEYGTRPDSLMVPQRAVTELQGKSFVWVVDAANKVTQRPVTVGTQIDDKILVVEGLKSGERIIVEGILKVREGSLVNPKTAEDMAAAAKGAAPSGTTKKDKD
jgi:membrane fusion protein (multidrug efflux system)